MNRQNYVKHFLHAPIGSEWKLHIGVDCEVVNVAKMAKSVATQQPTTT